MKQYLVARMRLLALLVVGALATTALVTPKWVDAQNAPEKIRLMADALRARDSGDLSGAKAKAEELIKIAPSDQNVQRLLASINRDLDRQGGSSQSRGPVFGQASTASTVDASLEQDAEYARVDAPAPVVAPEPAPVAQSTSEDSKADMLYDEAQALYESGDFKGAEAKIAAYKAEGGSSRKAYFFERKVDRAISDPSNLDIVEVSPEFVAQNDIIRDLLTRGRAQFLNGDYDGAQATFKEVEARDANNAEAKVFQTRIAMILGEIHTQNLYKTREQMLTEVDQQWERPKVFDITEVETNTGTGGNLIQDKMNAIIIPQVNFSGMALTQVIETLSELSVVYDEEQVGVNIIPLFNAEVLNPRVNLSLRNLSLDRILQFVTQQVNFAYDVGGDAVTIQRDNDTTAVTTATEFFPISRATVIRLTGFRDNAGSSGPIDPFAAPVSGGSSGPSQNEEVDALQNFFQSAGVNFELPGTSLAFDGEQLIVTQTRRNLERMRTILRNYNEVKQVEIEAKFLEVSQNDLDELGFDWSFTDGPRVLDTAQNRNLAGAFGVDPTVSAITITGDNPDEIPFGAPSIAGTIDLATEVTDPLFRATGWSWGNYDIDMAIRALSRESGSDLMSAPKVTVLSGKRANITVAQELRYPESYGDIESTVSAASGDSGGGAAISITAGTPQDFVTRNVGVELSVTPNVENDDTISLILEPRVTEFEGFVEYGGPSVALAEGTTVTVPAGFYQPIFSTRELSTEVTIFDGATVVMGGLTRDEVQSVNDKVPVLGDIPGVGRLFRSEGETRQKRNLLIFVTANLVSPGGSPSRQTYRNVNANSLFQNPTIMTPSGAANRSIPADAQ